MLEIEAVNISENSVHGLKVEHAENRLKKDIAENSYLALYPDGKKRPLIERMNLLDSKNGLAQEIADRISRGENPQEFLSDAQGRPISNGLYTHDEYLGLYPPKTKL